MKAKSKLQRKAAMKALSVMKGEQEESVLKGASKEMHQTLSKEALIEMTEPRKLSHKLK